MTSMNIGTDIAFGPGFDYFHLDSFLTDEQRAIRERIRNYIETVVKPNINPYWQREEFPHALVTPMADLGIVGGMIRGWGSAGLDPLVAGLVGFELSRGDGSISTIYGVQSGLAMGSIGLLGSDEQRERWLPDLAALRTFGAFGLTEPDRGSDAVGIESSARRDGNEYILNGAKRWIGNAMQSDVLVIWARDEQGDLGAFVIEGARHNNIPGLTMTPITGKMGKRAVINADILMQDVRVPADNRLAKVRSFRDAAKVLILGRGGVAWEAAGAATGAFEAALAYTQQREQFGRPIASYQLVQQKLVEMATEVTLMHLMCFQVAALTAQKKLTEGIASMAKYNSARKARQVALLAREVMGGNGLLIENHVARLLTDAEVIYTYEGTNEVQTLIIGRELTGINAIVPGATDHTPDKLRQVAPVEA